MTASTGHLRSLFAPDTTNVILPKRPSNVQFRRAAREPSDSKLANRTSFATASTSPASATGLHPVATADRRCDADGNSVPMPSSASVASVSLGLVVPPQVGYSSSEFRGYYRNFHVYTFFFFLWEPCVYVLYSNIPWSWTYAVRTYLLTCGYV